MSEKERLTSLDHGDDDDLLHMHPQRWYNVPRNKIIICVLIVASVAAVLTTTLVLYGLNVKTGGIDLGKYSHHVTLNEESYEIYFNISSPPSSSSSSHTQSQSQQQSSLLHIALKVNTNGWIGFGFGDPNSGSMPGADIVIAGVKDDGECYASDRYGLAYSLPLEDEVNNWKIIDCQQENGVSIIELTRPLDTCDLQDREIEGGPVRILYAWGSSDDYKYHGANRGMQTVTFYNGSHDDTLPPLPEDNFIIREFKMANASLAPIRTQYLCQTFDLSDIDDGQVIIMDPLIMNGSLAHHLLARICYGATEDYWNVYPTPTLCGSTGNISCEAVYYGWRSPSKNSYHFPSIAGIRVGHKVDYALRYFKLEIHYDNPLLLDGVIDDSGVRMTVSKELRAHDAGVMILGDVSSTQNPLPAATEFIHRENNCPAECTSTWPHDITIFSSTMHMHLTGIQAWTSHWINDTMVGDVNRADFYSSALEHQTPIYNYTIRRGDRLNTHCVYNTISRTDETVFGPESINEMCMNFVGYYPIMKGVGACGSYAVPRGSENSGTYCGTFMDLNMANPTIADPSGGEEILFGTNNSTC